jgi:hypothetical protein
VTEPTLDGVRIKLRRAWLHIQDLRKTLEPIVATAKQPGNIFSEQEEDPSKLVFRVKKVPEIDSLCSALVGDALFNMRSAFDHLAWQLVLLDGGMPGRRTQFPVASERPAEGVTIKPEIQRQDILDALEAVQPYRQENNQDKRWDDGLWVVNELNNHDKHRLVLPMLTCLNIDTDAPYWSLPEGVATPRWWFNAFTHLGPGDVVARFDFGGVAAPVEFEPNIALAITLDEGPPQHWIRTQPVPEMLDGVLFHLTWMVINRHFLQLFPSEKAVDPKLKL